MTEHSGRTILITGASSGIGAAAARGFAGAGANVVLVARSREPLEKLANELTGNGGRALACPADVTDTEALRHVVTTTEREFGGLDVLVNNAGFNARGAVGEVAVEDLQRIIDVNLRAPITLTRLALPYLQKSARANIINVASIAGRVPLPHEATYTATKFGLRGFSFAMAEEMHGSNVSVSVVSPGPVETDFILTDPNSVPDLVFSQPMSTAEQIAELILDCARDGARERVRPATSGKLATMAYLLPSLGRSIRPLMEKKGHRAKQRYLRDRQPG